MSEEYLSLSQSSLAYAKLAATPTDSAWSQVYNAGNLFACLSLTLQEKGEESPSLQTLGKELFSNLEAEFFTLEEKNLETIKEALQKSTVHIPKGVSLNFCLAFFKDHILYLFLLGRGRVIMKRGEKLGTLMEQQGEQSDLQTASGILHNGDTLIIETSQFAKNVSDKHIADALQLELPNDIADALSLHMHEQADGDQAAIIIVYHGSTKHPTMTTSAESSLPEKENEEDEVIPPTHTPKHEESTKHNPSLFAKISEMISRIRLPFSSQNRRIVMGGLTHRKKLFLSITLIILLLLIISIVFTKQKQESTQTASLFESIYTPALKSYDEGVALSSLNEDLSEEDFREAEQLLLEGKDKFPKDSKEAKQIEELLAKVQRELNPPEQETTSSPANLNLDRADLTISVLNGSGVAGAAGETADMLRDLGYTIETVGNADEYEYEGITIVITKEKEAYLNLLKKDLAGKTIQTEIDDTLEVDAEVIVGK